VQNNFVFSIQRVDQIHTNVNNSLLTSVNYFFNSLLFSSADFVLVCALLIAVLMINDRTMAARSLMPKREQTELHDGLHNEATHYPLYTTCYRMFLHHLIEVQ
jgi:hypothetical protein